MVFIHPGAAGVWISADIRHRRVPPPISSSPQHHDDTIANEMTQIIAITDQGVGLPEKWV